MFSQILRDNGDVHLSWTRDLFAGTMDGFIRKSKGNSANMHLREDCS